VSGLEAEFALQLDRALLRTMRAVLRRSAAPDTAGPLDAIEQELADVEQRLGAIPDDLRRPMSGLATRLRLDADQRDLLWTAVALTADPRLRVHAAELDDLAVHGLTTSLYCRIAELPADRARRIGLAFCGDQPLILHGLLQISRGDRIPGASPMIAAADLVGYLAGEPRADGDLIAIARPDAPIVDAAQTQAIARIAEALAGGAPLALFVEGPELTGRRTAVALASAQPVLAVDLGRHPPTAEGLGRILVALRRACLLRGALPLVAGVEEVGGGDGRDPRVRILGQFLDSAGGPVALVASRPGIDLGARLPAVRIAWSVPDVATRRRLWSALAGDGLDTDHDQLAVRFALGAGAVERAVSSARLLAGSSDAPLTTATLMNGVRQNIAERLGDVAERVTVKQRWDDLVLGDDAMTQVRALVARVRHAHAVYEGWGYRAKMPRGVGVAALFSGPPGTGKTMVAGLLAQELDLDLYQVDLSKIVSKWVGETEKQLARVFDAAEAGHALLLFDEADSLFGQRSSEMKGATDRYANLEVNFLLQRIESFGGVVVMTTNLDSVIDKALRRRLAAHVVFPVPDEEERALLWRRLLTTDSAPLADDLDIPALARTFPKMTGANIRNAVIAAAFLAAAEGTPITQTCLDRAARGEYASMGRVIGRK
jgi:AAA+ superfamily predicted ATPase